MRTHLVIPDTQVTPDTPTDHLEWIGKYIVERQPEVVVMLGDFADMESLSAYSTKREFEGRRYKADIESAKAAMRTLMAPIHSHNNKLRAWKEKLYKPEMHLTLGNHEYRIQRAVDDKPELEGIIGLGDLEYEKFGWVVHNFLKPVSIDGVVYAHYFANQQSGRPLGGLSMDTRLKNVGFSFSMGHQQVFMWGERPLNNGGRICGMVWGNCYLHDESYRGPQSNGERRGIMVKHEVVNGVYDPMIVSLDFLCRRYEGCHVWEYMKENYPDIYAQSTWMRFQGESC